MAPILRCIIFLATGCACEDPSNVTRDQHCAFCLEQVHDPTFNHNHKLEVEVPHVFIEADSDGSGELVKFNKPETVLMCHV